jgi:hypothetical protein
VKIYDKLKHAIRYFLLRRLPNCQTTVQKISESMEHPLSLRERVTVKVHLWICAWCQWYLEQLRVIRQTARSKTDDVPPLKVSLSEEARERIRRNLSSQI